MRKTNGRSFVLIMVLIAFAALVLRLAIDRIIKIDIAQNESNASVTLRFISAALQNYAKDHNGVFPSDLSLLVKNNPHYLDNEDITRFPVKGYNYVCTMLEPAGYSCSATPVKCSLTGKKSFTISTGGSIVSEECSKKE